MKPFQFHSRFPVYLFLGAFVIPVFLASCDRTCEKVAKRTIACAPDDGLRSSLNEQKDLILKTCRPHASGAKECLSFSNCSEFNRCMRQTVFFREAAPSRSGAPSGLEDPSETGMQP